ncbi:MAG: 50S ribosomal protein L21 [Chloroflexota bacterium]
MKYAIVESGGKQYKAVEGGTLEVDRLPVEAGASVKLEQVLLLADGENVTVGSPIVKDSPVWTKVVEHFKGKKVTIFNYSPKKRIRVKTGHRQNYTRLLVQQIGGAKLVVKEPEPMAAKIEKFEEPKAVKAETKTASTKAKAEAKPAAKAPSLKGKAEAKPAAKKAEVKKAKAKPAPKATSPKGKAESKPAAKTSSPKGKTSTKPAAKKNESK